MPQINELKDQSEKPITKYLKPSLLVAITTALAITAFSPTPTSAAEVAPVRSFSATTGDRFEAIEPLFAGGVEARGADSETATATAFSIEPMSAQFDYSVEATSLVTLPAPAYVPPASRQQVTEASATSFDYMGEDVPETNVGRTISPSGLALLKQLEGLELTGYKLGDGMCTIGYGHAEPLSTLDRNCTEWTITEPEAEAMLLSDVQFYADAVGNHFTRPLTQNQFDALTIFIYNVGPGILDTYAWHSEPSDDAIMGAMMLYTFPAQFREGLTQRRYAEIALFNS